LPYFNDVFCFAFPLSLLSFILNFLILFLFEALDEELELILFAKSISLGGGSATPIGAKLYPEAIL
jgi:hypothetical protein